MYACPNVYSCLSYVFVQIQPKDIICFLIFCVWVHSTNKTYPFSKKTFCIFPKPKFIRIKKKKIDNFMNFFVQCLSVIVFFYSFYCLSLLKSLRLIIVVVASIAKLAVTVCSYFLLISRSTNIIYSNYF